MPPELQSASGSPGVLTQEASDFLSLMQKDVRPKTDAAKAAVDDAVKTLAESALENVALVSDDALKTISSIIAAIDAKLTAQINQILHNADFQKIEGAWRGLAHLVNNTETDEKLKIRVLNISKQELSKTLKRFTGAAMDQSPLFKKIYEEEFGSPGGVPYGAIVGDYYFDQTPPDVELLRNMSAVAAAAHAPFLTGASPHLLGMDTWQEMGDKRDITKVFESAEYAPWRSLRDSDDARYLGLALPRFLSRLPYGAKTNPVEDFAFEEESDGTDHSKYTWANAAYAMATNITQAFKFYGWCSCIRGREAGGLVPNLPCHTFQTADGGMDMKCPTEIGITDRREAELAKNGFMPLSHWKNTDFAAFLSAQSLQKPKEYADPDASANAKLSANMPYLFAMCRFAHYLKVMVRDKIGTFKERADMENWLNRWITQYVTNSDASDEIKAQYPLAAAEVRVEEIPGNPGYYRSVFALRPHYQLEGLSISLNLVSKLPSTKKSG